MKQTFVRIALAAVCLSWAVAVVHAAEPTALTDRQAAAREIARGYTWQFYLGQLAVLHAKFTPEMKSTMDLDAFQRIRKQFDLELGSETGVQDESIEESEDYVMYVRRARFDKYEGLIEVRWILNDENAIAGVFFTPERTPADRP